MEKTWEILCYSTDTLCTLAVRINSVEKLYTFFSGYYRCWFWCRRYFFCSSFFQSKSKVSMFASWMQYVPYFLTGNLQSPRIWLTIRFWGKSWRCLENLYKFLLVNMGYLSIIEKIRLLIEVNLITAFVLIYCFKNLYFSTCCYVCLFLLCVLVVQL